MGINDFQRGAYSWLDHPANANQVAPKVCFSIKVHRTKRQRGTVCQKPGICLFNVLHIWDKFDPSFEKFEVTENQEPELLPNMPEFLLQKERNA